MAYSWTNNLPDGGVLPENSDIAPLATLTASDGGVDAVSYGIGNYSYGNYLFAIDDNGVLSPTSYLNDYELDVLSRASEIRHFSAIVNAYSADGDVVASRLFVLTLQDVDEFETEWVGTPPTGIAINENNPENFGPIVFNAVDGDGSAGVTYSLSGDDADYFTASPYNGGGGLYLKSSLDYEDRSHADGLYSVIVTATSTDGSDAISTLYVLTVVDVNEPVEWQTNPTGNSDVVLENIAIGTSVADFEAIDPEGAAGAMYGLGAYFDGFGLDGGSQGQYFNIDADTGVITTKSALDFETQEHYTLNVLSQADDKPLGTDVISQIFILTITDVNENIVVSEPTAWQDNGNPSGAALAENNNVGASLADFGATDGDGVAVTYSLSGADNAYFEIDTRTGVLTAKSQFDFENNDHGTLYSVTINATSLDGGEPISTLYVLTVVDVNEGVEWRTNLTGNADVVLENIAVGTSVADFDAIDPEGAGAMYGLGAYHDGFGLDGGSQGQYFNIDAYTGELTTKSALDFETQEHYTLNVLSQADDKPLGTDVISQIFILTITDVDEGSLQWSGTPPTGIAIDENNPENFGPIVFNAVDGDGADVTYSLSGDDADYFTASPYNGGGGLYLKSSLDYEDRSHADGLYSVIVTATSTDDSPAISTLYVLTVVDVNEPVEWQTNPTGNADVVLDNIAVGTSVADFEAIDPEGAAGAMYGLGAYFDGFGLDGGSQGQYFNIDARTGVITTKSALDFETQEHYTLNVLSQADDKPTGEGVISQIFILTITDVNENIVVNQPTAWQNNGNPSGAALAENNNVGASLADFGAIDGNGVAVAYSLSGADNAYFEIDTRTGVLTAKSQFDFENNDHGTLYSVTINATSLDGSDPISSLFILTIGDVGNTTPGWNDSLGDNPAGASIQENNSANISLADFDNDGPVAYWLSGAGSNLFKIDRNNGNLYVQDSVDYESAPYYSLVVHADATGAEASPISRLFVVTVGDVSNTNDWASDTTTGKILNENRKASIAVAHFDSNGPLPDGVSMTYALTGGDTDYFNIELRSNGLWRLSATSSFDYESDYGQSINNRYSVIITANATEEGTAISRTYILTIGDVGNTPDWNSDTPTGKAIDENNGTESLWTFDNDGVPRYVGITYGISGENTTYFGINTRSGFLRVKDGLDYESDYGQSIDNRYSVIITANTTEEGAAISRTYILTVNDVSNTPDWNSDTPTGHGFNENNRAGGLWNFNNDGALPPGVSITYGISDENTTYFGIDPNSGLLSVKANLDYESDYGQSINNRYSVIVTANATGGEEATAISRVYILTIGDFDNTNDWNSNTLTGKAIDENRGAGLNLWHFRNDGDLPAGVTMTYAISGDAVDYFTITNDVNVFGNFGRLRAKNSFDYESDYGQSIDNRYSVVVHANADFEGTEISRLFILTIGDVDNTPNWNSDTPTGKAIDENNGTESLWTFDNDGAPRYVDITYGISGENTTYFGINTRSGFLRVKSSLNYESDYGQSIDNRYSVIVTANATGGEGTAISRTYILTVNNIDNNEGWNYDYDNNPAGKSIEENSPSRYYMGTFQINSSDDVDITYGLMGENADNGYFKLEEHHSNPDIVHLITNSIFDYETEYGRQRDNRYSVVVVANAIEEGTAISRTFILTIGDYSNVPYWGVEYKRAIIFENNNPRTILVDLYNFDEYHNTTGLPEGVFVTYALWGENAEYFSVTPNEGHLSTRVSFDYESEYGQSINNNYTITIIANKTHPPVDGRGGHGDALNETFVLKIFNDPRDDVDNSSATTKSAPAPVAGLNGKVLFDGDADNIGGISDGIGNEGLIIIGDDLVATQYSDGAETNLVINNVENFEQSFVGYTDADGNTQNHWFFVRDDAEDNTGHIVFDADGMDVNLESLSSSGATTTPDQINLLAGINFETDGDFAKPDDLDLNLNNNSASALTHDQFLALIGGSNNIDFI